MLPSEMSNELEGVRGLKPRSLSMGHFLAQDLSEETMNLSLLICKMKMASTYRIHLDLHEQI